MNLLTIQEPERKHEGLEKRLAFGIDLGTTNSLIAASINQKPFIIEAEDGSKLLKSILSINSERKFEVGESKAEHKISSSKRLIGKAIHDLPVLLPNLLKQIDKNRSTSEMLYMKLSEFSVTPIEVAAEILKKLKLRAENYTKQEVKQCVITVPAYFDDAARQATKYAASLAGLEVLRLINEPTAASLAYGLGENLKGLYLIYDLGGGTFDASILKFDKGIFRVLATAGNTELGGDDIDEDVAKFLSQKYNKPIDINYARALKEKPGSELTLDELNNIAEAYIEKTIKICKQALKDAGISAKDLAEIVLVGGSTRLSLVKEMVEKEFYRKPLCSIDPDIVVALGAAIQADSLVNGSDNLLLDVNPLSLGVEIMGGLTEKIISRNSSLPSEAVKEFTTHIDGQTGMDFHIVQGEREFAKDCRSLAKFTLNNIPPMKAGIPKIRTKFRLDADGILTVSAEELNTGTSQEILVKPSYGLELREIEDMLFDAINASLTDKENREIAELKLEIEQLFLMIDDVITNDPELISEEELAKIVVYKVGSVGDKSLLQKLEIIANNLADRKVSKYFTSDITGKNIEFIKNKYIKD
jgi:molecular chaperone HscA